MSYAIEYLIHDDCGQAGLPKRSTLYRLEPRELGTARRESLSSFVMRLAHEHAVSPTRLAEFMKQFSAETDGLFNGDWAHPYISGVGSTARMWSTALAAMTGHATLESLTLLHLSKIVSTTGLMSERRRWCPECLVFETGSDVPHGHLLWEISVVEACPEHHLVLSSTCRCGMTGRKWRIKRLPHLCGICGMPLSLNSHRMVANKEQVRIARIVAEYLGDPRFDGATWRDEMNGPVTFLREVVRVHFEGRSARLAKALGVSKGALHDWCAAAHRPTFSRLVLLAERLGCSLADVLSGRVHDTRPPTRQLPRDRTRKPNADAAQLRTMATRLMALSRRVPAISLSAVARELGTSPKFLRAKHAGLSRRIVKRYLTEVTRRRRERERSMIAEVATLVAEGGLRNRAELERVRQREKISRRQQLFVLGMELARVGARLRTRSRKGEPGVPDSCGRTPPVGR